MPELMRSRLFGASRWLGPALLAGFLLAGPGCQPQREAAETISIPPVGHYAGGIAATGQPELRAALDIRHPRPGHYEAELTVPAAGTLSFVADTIFFSNNKLRLVRPARPGQTLTLTLEGDFWRGSLTLDSTKAPTILLRRGVPAPSTYRVAAVLQKSGPAWLFSPADVDTPGAALVLLPSIETGLAAALWADGLAREGLIVLVLPAADTATAAPETLRLQAALRLLRGIAGADTARVGVWAAGARAATLAPILAAVDGPRAAFFITQNAPVDAAARVAFRELKRRKLPILGLYSGTGSNSAAAALRQVLGGRRGTAVRSYRAAGADLLVPGALGPRFGPGLPDEVVGWLRER